MDLTHRFSVPASVEETWTAFNHLDRLAPCFPGASISSTHGDHFEGSIKIKLGPMALVYSGSGRFLERDPAAHRLVFQASGDERRGNGTATATVAASLVGNGSGTDVELVTDLDFTGRPAQFGSGVVSDVSDKLVDQFVSCVSVRFADGLGAPVLDDEAAAAEPVADDELWEEWAAGDESDDLDDRADEQPTVEMAAVGTDAAPVEHQTGLADRPESEPAPQPTAASASYRYTPPTDLSQAETHAVVNVVTTLLRRYGLLLGIVAVVVIVVTQIIDRRRR
jgi:carbon monoxide dehydrogenase subunit G